MQKISRSGNQKRTAGERLEFGLAQMFATKGRFRRPQARRRRATHMCVSQIAASPYCATPRTYVPCMYIHTRPSCMSPAPPKRHATLIMLKQRRPPPSDFPTLLELGALGNPAGQRLQRGFVCPTPPVRHFEIYRYTSSHTTLGPLYPPRGFKEPSGCHLHQVTASTCSYRGYRWHFRFHSTSKPDKKALEAAEPRYLR